MDKGTRVLERIVHAANTRQKVLASNIANSDTPGYKARDVKFKNLLSDEKQMLTTDPKHIGSSSNDRVAGNIEIQENLSWGDGNNVEIDTARMTENALLHDAAVTILSAKIRMYKNAIRTK